MPESKTPCLQIPRALHDALARALANPEVLEREYKAMAAMLATVGKSWNPDPHGFFVGWIAARLADGALKVKRTPATQVV